MIPPSETKQESLRKHRKTFLFWEKVSLVVFKVTLLEGKKRDPGDEVESMNENC